jgi:hypothetical protein
MAKEAKKRAKAKQAAKSRAARSQKRGNRKKACSKDYEWKGYSRDQQEVGKRIGAGDYEMITGTGWGFLDRFFIFLFSIGFFSSLEVEGSGFERIMVPLAKLFMTYEMKILLGIQSVNKISGYLFRDTALLMMIGFTAKQIQEGFCNRDRGKRQGPVIPQTLAEALGRLSTKEADYILNKAIEILCKRGFIRAGTFIIDSTDLLTTEKYEGAGRRTVMEQKRDKDGKLVEIPKTEYGFKLIIIKELQSRMVVAAKLVKIQEHESPYTLELVCKAERNMGKKAKIKILLMDRGFLDGLTLWKLKHQMGIDWIVPAKTNLHITQDIRSLRDAKDNESIYREHDLKDEIWVVGVAALLSYDQYGGEEHQKNINRKDFKANPLNAVMVTRWKGEDYHPSEEKVFLTSLPVDQPLQIIKKYNLRCLIENLAFRELKQGWLLKAYPKKTENAVRAHVFLTLAMFSATNCYRSSLGQKLAEKGIRRWRADNLMSIHKVVVFAGEYYGVFDIEEIMTLVGKPPKHLLRTDLSKPPA